MGDILIIFVFVVASVIFFIGMILVILNKLELETDNNKEKKLLNSLYGAIFMIVITISIPILTYFFGTDDNSGQYQPPEHHAVVISEQQMVQHNTSNKEDLITLKYVLVFGITAFLNMILLVPTILLINMFRKERGNYRRRLLRDIYFIISLVILLNIVIAFTCLVYSL
jgi:hypothetical protein